MKKKKKLLSRITSTIRKGSIQFSPSWPPVSYSFPLGKKRQSPRAKRDKEKPPLLIPSEIIPPGAYPSQTFPLVQRGYGSPAPNPIQRETLPMIAKKIDEAKALGRNDLVLFWSTIEYGVRHPRKFQRTVENVLDFLDQL